MISKKVISNHYVFGLTMLICILTHMNCTSIITKYFNMVIHPKDLSTTCPSRNILCLGGCEGYRILFLGDHETRQLLRNWHVPLVLFHPLYNPHVGIRKTRHEKLSGLRIPQTHFNCALKVSNNAFYRNQVGFFRTRLESSTKTHTKHNVWPTSH